MEYCIDIMIKKEDFRKVGIWEEYVKWGNVLYSDTPKRLYTEENILLREISFSEDSNKEETITIIDGLSEFETQLCNNESIYNNSIMKFIKRVLSLNNFKIIIRDVDSKIDTYIKYDKTVDVLNCLKKVFIENKNIELFKN